MVRVAINEELAGLFPTQKPGNVSKIATFTSPPYLAEGDEAACGEKPLPAAEFGKPVEEGHGQPQVLCTSLQVLATKRNNYI